MSDPKPRKRLRPEVVTAVIATGGVFAVLGFLLTTHWAYLIMAMASPLSLAAIMLLAGVLLFLVLDGPTRTLVRYMYMSLMRWITQWFVRIDPVEILQDDIERLEGRMKDMRIQRDTLRVEIHKLLELVRLNQNEISALLQSAHKGQDSKKKTILNARKAARKRGSNDRLQALLKKMRGLDDLLTRMYDNAFIMVEDVKDRIEIKVLEREALSSGHSAMKNAMSILKGGDIQQDSFERAMTQISEDIQGKIGKIEHFMDMSEHVLETIDLQNGVYQEEGLVMLEQWQQEQLKALEMEEYIEGIHPEAMTQSNRAASAERGTDRYNELLE